MSAESELTPKRLTELRRIAQAATPGPWRMHDLDDSEVTSYITSAALPPIMPELATVRFADDAHYIAAFSPPTVLALLDRIEELEVNADSPEEAKQKALEISANWQAKDRNVAGDKVVDLFSFRRRLGRRTKLI